MSCIWSDFPSGQKGLYGTNIAYALNGIWAGRSGTFASSFIALTTDPDPNIGSAGVVLHFNPNSSQGAFGDIDFRFALPNGATTTVGIAARLWMTALPEADTNRANPRLLFKTTGNATICYIQVGATGQITAYNSSGASLGTTSGPVVTADAYSHIEVKCLRDAAAGTIEVRVNGVAKLTLTGLALGSSDIGTVAIGSALSSAAETMSHYWKDVVFWDTSGTENNDFLGSVSVYDQIEDGDLSFNWTASSGTTGYNLINEGDSGPVDTSYISADSSPPAASSFSMADLPADVTSVRALFPIARMEKTDGGDCTVQMGLSPDGTNWDDGADRAITTAFTYWWDVSEVSPATAVAWTPVEANSLEFRINRTL